jgi:predicted nucleic acid-binding protein
MEGFLVRSVVSNATPLIYLAKIGKLELLKIIFGEVVIPEEVRVEVVEKGKQLGRKDAYVVEKAIVQGWIRVISTDPLEMPILLDKGEEEALSLAKQQKAEVVLVDEVSARSAARLLGLKPRGTLFVLLMAMRKKQLDFDEFLQTLDQLIEQGFRLREEVYVQAVKEAKRITNKK